MTFNSSVSFSVSTSTNTLLLPAGKWTIYGVTTFTPGTNPAVTMPAVWQDAVVVIDSASHYCLFPGSDLPGAANYGFILCLSLVGLIIATRMVVRKFARNAGVGTGE